MEFPAHIRVRENGEKEIQTVAEHCRNCAEYASESTERLRHLAYLAGLLHDFGKMTQAAKNYLSLAAAGEHVIRGSVNHTFAGVRFTMEHWYANESSFSNLSCEMIAYAIGSHHGMFDCINPDGKDGFLYRLTKEGIHYEEAKANFLPYCAAYDELDKLFEASVKEIKERFADCQKRARSQEEMQFYIGLMSRMLLSNVIDADRRDTAEFMNAISYPEELREKEQLKKRWEDCLNRIEMRLSGMGKDRRINQVRQLVSEQCHRAARWGSGIYRLSVPTGGGKTLASLRYALATAKNHGKKRIIFVIPLLSVLEQNAAVIREWISDDNLILEHHSNVVRERDDDELDDKELLMDTWNAPILITTLVQLLNTLFSGKSSCIRRMRALEDSVIVIDEVQSVPRKLLTLFNLAMNFLAYSFGTTIVLSSATQPCLEVVEHPLCYGEPPDLVKLDKELLEVFRRTEIIDRRKLPDGYCAREIAEFAVACMDTEGSSLVICNTKKQAAEVFQAAVILTETKVFHLSTAMCMAHRKLVMDEINKHLEAGEPILCVSTQLVEAGVDFSFASVIRISAGLDNVIQAAGRCNRSGEKGRICNVYIVNYKGENLKFLKGIKRSQNAAEDVLVRFEQDKEFFDGDLTSEKAIQAYYRRLYTDMQKQALDYPIAEYDTSLYILLSNNRTGVYHCKTNSSHLLSQAFQTAGKAFTVFEDNTYDVLVPYDEGVSIITLLAARHTAYDFYRRKALLDQAKEYTISLYEYQLKKLQEMGGIYKICEDSILVLQAEFYHEEVGFFLTGDNYQFLEV